MENHILRSKKIIYLCVLRIIEDSLIREKFSFQFKKVRDRKNFQQYSRLLNLRAVPSKIAYIHWYIRYIFAYNVKR